MLHTSRWMWRLNHVSSGVSPSTSLKESSFAPEKYESQTLQRLFKLVQPTPPDSLLLNKRERTSSLVRFSISHQCTSNTKHQATSANDGEWDQMSKSKPSSFLVLLSGIEWLGSTVYGQKKHQATVSNDRGWNLDAFGKLLMSPISVTSFFHKTEFISCRILQSEDLSLPIPTEIEEIPLFLHRSILRICQESIKDKAVVRAERDGGEQQKTCVPSDYERPSRRWQSQR